jgi:hypothetical protein
MGSSKCSDKPIFVVIAETPSGYSFDNDVKYSSPFANHTITQTSDMTHPSIMVNSNWGMAKKNSITQMVTGNAGFKILQNRKNTNFYKSYSTGEAVGLLLNDTHGYRLGRYKGLSGEAPSVAELANLLGSVSRSSKDVKVRGSPLEYKRLLDYFQFLLARKVSGTGNSSNNLYLVRPNNVNILDDMNDTSDVSLEDVYMGLFDGDLSNRTMYNKAYFVSGDRPAAIASVVRQVPTIFQEKTGKKMHLMPMGDNNGRIRRYLDRKLRQLDYTISSNGTVSKDGVIIIDKTDDISWYLDTGVLFQKKPAPNIEQRVLLLFYWVFNYPAQTSNVPIIEAFFSIVDTFHDFKPTTRTDGKSNNNSGAIGSLMGQNKNRQNFKARRANTINLTNVSNTRIAHRTLVRLLGSDIYRKVRSGYSESLKNTVSGVNKRTFTPNEKVGRFLYFITSIFGSDPGTLIKACEELSKDILIDISGNNPIYTRIEDQNQKSNPLCAKLESEGACLIIDMIFGSLPDCLMKHSVFHNVGVLDPASKKILSWSEVEGGDGCIETPKDQKKRKQKKAEARKRASKLKDSKAKQKAGEQRKVKSQATRIETVKKMANKARQNQINIARRRQIATARREGGRTVRNTQPAPTPFTRTNTPSNMKMTMGKVSPKKPPLPPTPFTRTNTPSNMKMTMGKVSPKKPPLPPTLKRSRNNKPPLPPRSGVTVSRGPGNAPATGTRSVRSVQRTRNAPPASGTRSASARRTPVAQTPTSTARRTPVAQTPTSTVRRTPVAQTPASTSTVRRTPGTVRTPK